MSEQGPRRRRLPRELLRVAVIHKRHGQLSSIKITLLPWMRQKHFQYLISRKWHLSVVKRKGRNWMTSKKCWQLTLAMQQGQEDLKKHMNKGEGIKKLEEDMKRRQ